VLREHDLGFLWIAPKADDVWVHSRSVKSGVLAAQLRIMPRMPAEIPGSQSAEALFQVNVLGGGNDLAISRAYGAMEVARLSSDG